MFLKTEVWLGSSNQSDLQGKNSHKKWKSYHYFLNTCRAKPVRLTFFCNTILSFSLLSSFFLSFFKENVKHFNNQMYYRPYLVYIFFIQLQVIREKCLFWTPQKKERKYRFGMTYGRIAIFGICPVNIKTIMLVKTSNPILLTHSCNYKRQQTSRMYISKKPGSRLLIQRNCKYATAICRSIYISRWRFNPTPLATWISARAVLHDPRLILHWGRGLIYLPK